MAKVLKIDNVDGEYIFYCPGCEKPHLFDKRWEFNGDIEKPTFSPSLLCNPDHEATRCHSFVRSGFVEYQGDCYHELAGKTVEIPEWSDDLW